jgi:biopolymer transport protein ExbD
MAMGGKAGETFTEINVTPLTDVFLVLLVIMILIAPLVNQAVLKVSPPGLTMTPPKKDDTPKLNVEVGADGSVTLNNKPVIPPDTPKIMEAIKAEQAAHQGVDMPLILNSDEEALQKHVVAVMDAAAGCDIKNMAVLPPHPTGAAPKTK